MNRLVLAAALIALPGAALAQETDWTGFYTGVGVGIKSTLFDIEHDDDSRLITFGAGKHNQINGEPVSSSVLVPTAHVLAGYRHQFDTLVVGLEADAELNGPATAATSYSTLGRDGTTNVDYGTSCEGLGLHLCALATTNVSFQSLGHVRGLLGVAVAPDALVFASGGLAIGKARVRSRALAIEDYVSYQGRTELFDQQTQVMYGPSIGVGGEIKATDNLSLRLEGMIDSFGTLEYDVDTGTAGVYGGAYAQAAATGIATFHVVTVRASAIWQF